MEMARPLSHCLVRSLATLQLLAGSWLEAEVHPDRTNNVLSASPTSCSSTVSPRGSEPHISATDYKENIRFTRLK